MPIRDGAKRFLQSKNHPSRALPERGLPEGIQSGRQLPNVSAQHGTTLWLLAVGALACFLGAVVIACRHTKR